MTETQDKPVVQTVEFKAQPGPQSAFQSTPADIAVYGGARGGGKTFALDLEPMRHVHMRRFRSVLFRRTFPQIYQEGGPWDTAERIYPYAGATSSGSTWRFPSGAQVSFHHLANDDDWKNWLGAQIPLIMFDQLETFTERQFFAMIACNRDPHGEVRPYIRASANPDPDSWLAKFVAWWLDPATGYPIPERAGVIRWFIRSGDVVRWASKKSDLDRYRVQGPDGKVIDAAKSVTFIPAFVHDNAELMRNDPTYLASLMSQPLVEQERWVKGNWKIKPSAGTVYNRAWFKDKVIEALPAEANVLCRFTDLAHSAEPEEGSGKDPDWTAQVKGARFGNKFFVVHAVRWRKSSLETEQCVKASAQADGWQVKQAMEQEPAAGKSLCAYYQREVLAGFHFVAVPSVKAKIIRAGPLSSALQAGNVFLVRGEWNEWFVDMLEAFRGDEEKNDVPDAAAGCYNELFQGASDSAGSVGDRDPDRTNFGRVNRRGIF